MNALSVRAAVLLLTTVCMTGCALLLPCKGIKHGVGVTASGALAAGEHASHTLELTRGAQNDVYVTPRDSVPGTTYTIYVTSAVCTTFSPEAEKWVLRYPVIPQDPCAIIAGDTLRQIIAGRGRSGPGASVIVRDHEVSGANQFKLWIIGDPRVPISYEVRVWWASGNDC